MLDGTGGFAAAQAQVKRQRLGSAVANFGLVAIAAVIGFMAYSGASFLNSNSNADDCGGGHLPNSDRALGGHACVGKSGDECIYICAPGFVHTGPHVCSPSASTSPRASTSPSASTSPLHPGTFVHTGPIGSGGWAGGNCVQCANGSTWSPTNLACEKCGKCTDELWAECSTAADTSCRGWKLLEPRPITGGVTGGTTMHIMPTARMFAGTWTFGNDYYMFGGLTEVARRVHGPHYQPHHDLRNLSDPNQPPPPPPFEYLSDLWR